MNTTEAATRIRFTRAVREALVVLAAGAGLGLAYGALTDEGIFRPAAPPPASAPLEEQAGAAPEAPMMVSVDEAEEIFRSGQGLFVDARSEFDYGLGHIKGAVNLPLKSASKGASLLPDVPRDRMVVTYCDGANCNSSIDLAARLYASGFSDVRIFFGGWEEWRARALPTEGTRP